MRLMVTMAAACLALLPIASTAAADPSWERWQSVSGVFDLGGPRTDGSLVVAGSAALYQVDAAGNLAPFANGPNGYHQDAGLEAYLAESPGSPVAAAGCSFVRDETFVLRLHKPVGIDRIDALGQNVSAFANVSAVTSLNGIAFDTTGAFDHKLLVSGPSGSKIAIAAIDCNGGVQIINASAPVLEGGLAVAPRTFGAFGGDLIAPDELSGRIYAIAPDGTVATVATPSLPTGGDIGVESLAFVPPGFMRGGAAYYADRKTAGNPHPGTDSVLRVSSADLAGAGVQEGDLLAATEGGASMVAVRCGASCTVIPVIATPTTAHGEGHIVFTINKAAPSPSPSPSPSPKATAKSSSQPPGIVIALAILIVLMLLVAGSLLASRRRR